MVLSLTHLGEEIFAAMVNSNRGSLLSLPNLPHFVDPQFVKTARQIAFPEIPLANYGNRAFDGACRIDVAVQLQPHTVTAFELKLGVTRLGSTRVNEEWLVPCAPSHRDRRWKGNVMAALERKFSETIVDELAATINAKPIRLTREWFVVARRETIAAWNERRPGFTQFAGMIAFEDVVAGFGGEASFNQLVRGMLDINFYNEWVAANPDAG